jgi:hypothetical protein
MLDIPFAKLQGVTDIDGAWQFGNASHDREHFEKVSSGKVYPHH